MPINSFLYPAPSLPPAYSVANSCMFNDGDTPRLHKTAGSAGNRRTFTISAWIKRSALGANQSILCATANNATADGDANKTMLRFTSDDELRFVKFTSASVTNQIITNAKYRDVSAWLHVLLAVDTTSGTAGDRLRLYVNGSEVTSFGTESQPDQNYDYDIGNSVTYNVGYGTATSTHVFDG